MVLSDSCQPRLTASYIFGNTGGCFAFLTTGVMAYGPRKICEAAVLDRGGSAASGVSKKVSYLVIGSIGNEQWRHSSHGVKIVKAVDLRDAGAPIAIISEDHWQKCLFG